MTAKTPTDRDALLMLLSAYLDGELAPAEEARVIDALAQDPTLLPALEQLAAARGSFSGAALDGPDADALTASVLAASEQDPSAMPDTVGGATQLSSLAIDGALDDPGARRLDAMLTEKPALAPAVAGFIASAEAVQVATRGVGMLAGVQSTLAAVPDHVDAAIAARERTGALASAGLDGALTPAEHEELVASLAGSTANDAADAVEMLQAARAAGEALAAAAASPAFARAAQRAGEAALHAIESERVRAARPDTTVRAPARDEQTGVMARVRRLVAIARFPLAFAATAAALFIAFRDPGTAADEVAAREAAKKALFDALAPTVIADPVDIAAAGDLPLLADNSADVEAIDATSTTMVFATESSNITVIWVADEDDTQGT